MKTIEYSIFRRIREMAKKIISLENKKISKKEFIDEK